MSIDRLYSTHPWLIKVQSNLCHYLQLFMRHISYLHLNKKKSVFHLIVLQYSDHSRLRNNIQNPILFYEIMCDCPKTPILFETSTYFL